MRATNPEIRPPGIYAAPVPQRQAGIDLARSGIPGFVGLAARGPLDVPVRIGSIAQFLDVFGELDAFLQPAVEGFFRNGGQECHVVRIAHRRGRSPGEFAARAGLFLEDGQGRPVLQVEASSEGAWGNAIALTVRRQAPRTQTFLTLDARKGACEAVVRSTHGFGPGTLVRISDDDGETFRYVRGVDGKSLAWDPAQPLDRDWSAAAPTYVEPVEFGLDVATPFARETFPNLSLHPASLSYVGRAVNERSRLVRVAPTGEAAALDPHADRLPAALEGTLLARGADGLDGVTPDDFIGMSAGPDQRSGLAALEAIDEIDLLAAPDLMWVWTRNAESQGMPFSTRKDVELVQDAMIAQCERLADRFALLDAPFPTDAERTREYRLGFDSRFAALYFPWLRVERRGTMRAVPPSGHVAGLFARCDAAAGPHRPPANEALEDAQDLTLVLRDDDVGLLNGEGINCLVAQGNRGLRVWGARTASADPAWRYVNVRRVVNAINKSMNASLQWVVFEPNLPSLWKTVARDTTAFLMALWKKGWFQGDAPEDAFYVKCDDETNPPEERDAGRLVVEVGVAPVRPAEFLILRMAQEMQGSTEVG